ncbi:MAG: hypothetical protein CVV10_04095 [Gammaproteobacteria bacterium HGW-Gammaproteobacteria-14]|nr:MAG: hypothetical protein CVV10_04095 [Gammaproteobacteria bacterium HGW-Gammaproteobacteria-14]
MNRLTQAYCLSLVCLLLAACGGSGGGSSSGGGGGSSGGGNQTGVSNLELIDIDGTATVEIMPETLGDAVALNRADAALISNTLAKKPVAIIVIGGDLVVTARVTSTSDHLLTLEADGDLLISAEMSVGALEIIAGDYSILAPINLPAGNTFTLNGAPYTVITELGAEGDESGTTLQGINGNLAANYALGANIDASATTSWHCSAPENCMGFAPLGNVSTGFSGHFNGLGHVVDHLFVNRPLQDYAGLIGYMAPNASVRYAGIENANVTGYYYVGGLVGSSDEGAVVSHSYVTGTVSGGDSGDSIGGLVGENYKGTVIQSYATALVSGDDSVGGLVGNNYQGAVSYSHATGGVSGKGMIGGLVGESYQGTVRYSYATGAVTGADGANSVGGLIGVSEGINGVDGGTVTYSYATGAVTGNASVGGLVGASEKGSVVQSYATGAVSGSGNAVGGLVGLSRSYIYRSYATGEVDGTLYVGGLVGWTNNSTVAESFASGAVSGDNTVGGLVGYNNFAEINQGYATGAVIGNGLVGGLVGHNVVNSFVYQSYATGQVTGNGDFIGGLVGYNANGGLRTSFWSTTANADLDGVGTDVGESINIIGKTLAELMTLATFTDAALGADAWDVDTDMDGDSLWLIEEGVSTPWIRALQ